MPDPNRTTVPLIYLSENVVHTCTAGILFCCCVVVRRLGWWGQPDQSEGTTPIPNVIQLSAVSFALAAFVAGTVSRTWMIQTYSMPVAEETYALWFVHVVFWTTFVFTYHPSNRVVNRCVATGVVLACAVLSLSVLALAYATGSESPSESLDLFLSRGIGKAGIWALLLVPVIHVLQWSGALPSIATEPVVDGEQAAE